MHFTMQQTMLLFLNGVVIKIKSIKHGSAIFSLQYKNEFHQMMKGFCLEGGIAGIPDLGFVYSNEGLICKLIYF